MNNLSAKQEKFVKEYLVDCNGTQAAIRAGYAKNSANEQAARLLAKDSIQAAVDKLKVKQQKRTQITADRVLQEVERLGMSQLSDYVKWGPDGVVLKDSSELTPDQAAAVSEVTQTYTKDGGSIKFKLHDKGKMLELLGKHLSLFNEKVDHAPIVINVNLPDDVDVD